MAIVPIENLGEIGIIKDIPPYQLPPNAWSDGNNVRVLDNAIKKCTGYQEILATCPISPLYVTALASGSEYFWVACGTAKVYVHDGSSWTNITRQTASTDVDYSATAAENWSATVIGGVLVLNNAIDDPQEWPTTAGVAATATKLQDLSNWPASTTCKVTRAFKTFLVALNVSESGTDYPRLVKWSHEAATHSVPSSWDETSASLDAGEYELAQGSAGEIVDGMTLGDAFIIFKEDSIVQMSYVGSPFIFSFRILSPTIGAIAKNCAAEFDKGIFFFGNSDLYLMDGQNIHPLLPNKLRRWLFDSIDGDAFSKCFVAADYARKEMLACFPTIGSTYPDKAIIWNWHNNAFSIRDLPNVSHIAYGIAEITGGRTWATITDTWDTASSTWGTRSYDAVLKNLVLVDPGNTKLYRDDYGNTEDGTNMTAYVERTGLSIGAQGAPDQSSIKHVKAVYPKMEVSGSNTVNVYVGSQMSNEEGVTWEGPYTFNPDTQSKVPCRVTGRYFGVKFESTTNSDWKLHGLEFDVKEYGRRGSFTHS